MKSGYKKFQFALVLVLAHSILLSQSYSFSLIPPGEIPYEEIDSSIPAAEFNGTLDIIDELNGETFLFYDVPFTFGGLKTIAMGNNAFMRIDNDSSMIIIDGAFTAIDTLDGTSKRSYAIEGNSGNRVLKLQYKNLTLTNGEAGNYMNVQIWYYQSTGVVEVHYGPSSESNASGFNSSNGPHAGMFYSADDFSVCYEKLWCTGSPNSPTLAQTSNYVFSAMGGLPDEGTVFRFTPTFVINNTGSIPDVEIPVMFPNPTTGMVFIDGLPDFSVIQLLDLTGKRIDQFSPKGSTFSLDIAGYDDGLYFLKLITNKTQKTYRLVKE
jgi:Secretion system C-terminal sorting domain